MQLDHVPGTSLILAVIHLPHCRQITLVIFNKMAKSKRNKTIRKFLEKAKQHVNQSKRVSRTVYQQKKFCFRGSKEAKQEAVYSMLFIEF